jgi:hypothetical protein
MQFGSAWCASARGNYALVVARARGYVADLRDERDTSRRALNRLAPRRPRAPPTSRRANRERSRSSYRSTATTATTATAAVGPGATPRAAVQHAAVIPATPAPPAVAHAVALLPLPATPALLQIHGPSEPLALMDAADAAVPTLALLDTQLLAIANGQPCSAIRKIASNIVPYLYLRLWLGNRRPQYCH